MIENKQQHIDPSVASQITSPIFHYSLPRSPTMLWFMAPTKFITKHVTNYPIKIKIESNNWSIQVFNIKNPYEQ